MEMEISAMTILTTRVFLNTSITDVTVLCLSPMPSHPTGILFTITSRFIVLIFIPMPKYIYSISRETSYMNMNIMATGTMGKPMKVYGGMESLNMGLQKPGGKG